MTGDSLIAHTTVKMGCHLSLVDRHHVTVVTRQCESDYALQRSWAELSASLAIAVRVVPSTFTTSTVSSAESRQMRYYGDLLKS